MPWSIEWEDWFKQEFHQSESLCCHTVSSAEGDGEDMVVCISMYGDATREKYVQTNEETGSCFDVYILERCFAIAKSNFAWHLLMHLCFSLIIESWTREYGDNSITIYQRNGWGKVINERGFV